MLFDSTSDVRHRGLERRRTVPAMLFNTSIAFVPTADTNCFRCAGGKPPGEPDTVEDSSGCREVFTDTGVTRPATACSVRRAVTRDRSVIAAGNQGLATKQGIGCPRAAAQPKRIGGRQSLWPGAPKGWLRRRFCVHLLNGFSFCSPQDGPQWISHNSQLDRRRELQPDQVLLRVELRESLRAGFIAQCLA